jgi:SDR family mycofactocin-dependent oxidoreductase
MGRLDGKVALITGGARGQGRAHAIGMAQEGADIAICDIGAAVSTPDYPLATPDDLRETEKLVLETGRRCVAVEADVRDRPALRDFISLTIETLGGIDIVAANAGIITYNSLWDLTDEQWDEVIDVNLTGVWNIVRACVPQMISQRRGGSIVLTSSTAGLVAVPGAASYTAAKHGVIGIMKSLAVELGSFGIRANCVHPTAVKTPMVMNQATYDLFSGHSEGTFETADEIGRSLNLLDVGFIEPDDVTQAIIFLCCDQGRWITGTSLKVDAGATVNPAGQWRNVPSQGDT